MKKTQPSRILRWLPLSAALSFAFGCAPEGAAPLQGTTVKAATHDQNAAKAPPPTDGATKNSGGPWARKAKAMEAVAHPLEMEARGLFESGKYGPALAKYREAAAKWQSIGARGGQDEIVECLFRLGRHQEAVDTARAKRIFNPQVELSVALSLLRLRRTDEARQYLNLEEMARYVGKDLRMYIAAPTNATELEADLHLSRALELFFTADYEEALVEFRQAYRLDPKNLATAVLGHDASITTHHSDDALAFATAASRVPGSKGNRARSYLKRTAAPAGTSTVRRLDKDQGITRP